MTSPALRLTEGAVALAVFAVPLMRLATKAQSPPPAYANFEEAQTNPIRLSADGTRLLAVNTPNTSLSVFDVTAPGSPKLLAEIPVGIGPVSVNPLTDDEAWVVNQVSNSISIVSVSRGIVTNTIAIKPEPMDVVFAGGQAYVSVSRDNAIAVLDVNSQTLIKILPVFGGNPRALAVSPSGNTVYAAFALSGNATTLIPPNLAPPQPPPTNPQLPPPPQVGLIVSATDPNWTSYVTFKMPDNDVVAIQTGANPTVSGYYSGVGTINLGLGADPVTGDLYVANTDALNLTNFEPNLRGHWVNNRITRIQVKNGQITPFDLNPGIDYSILPNPKALSTVLAQPTSVVFDPGGAFMWVAAFGTDRVAQVSTSGSVLGFVEVSPPSGSGANADPANKRGPRGLALNAGAHTLYALNRISNTISIINTATKTISGEIPVGTDPTPQTIKSGRGFLYDAKLSGNGTGACSSCHVDGDMDHLAWNLGNPGGTLTTTVQNGQVIVFHPMKGPMMTQTLRGLLNLSPYHWRGDQPNFQAFNSAFDSLMGGSQISTSDMNLFTGFANTILYLPNPNENLDRTLPNSFQGGNPVQGEFEFMALAKTKESATLVTCDSCHTANPGPGTNRLIRTSGTQPMKIPQLRNIYQKQLFTRFAAETIDGFGMAHDGTGPSVVTFFQDPSFALYTQTEVNDISAYELCFDTGTAPAVGNTRTLTSGNVTSMPAQSDWKTLQSQAAAGNIDLIARGTIQARLHGLLYQPLSNNYISDTGSVYTKTQLQAFILAGDTLSFMGVYPGTGTSSVK